MGMASPYLGRRRRPAASLPCEAASSSRSTRARYSSPALPLTPVQTPTSPSYSPTSPLPRRHDDEDEIGDDGQDDDDDVNRGHDHDHDEEDDEGASDQSNRGGEREDSHGSDADSDIGEEEGSESDGGMEPEDWDGSDGDNNGSSESEQHQQYDDDDEIEEEGEREVSDGAEEEQQVQEEEQHQEEPPQPQPRSEGSVAAGNGDLAPPPTLRPASPPSSRSGSSAGGAMAVTVERTELDCGICFLPLKPPIFQCDVGHVVCSSCRDKLPAAGRCHVCRATTRFRRCHAMEHLLDAIRVPCPHAAHGCAATPAYHDRERHARECPHAPCRCPSPGGACSFAGGAAALARHIVADHGWPCTAEAAPGVSFRVDLKHGRNFLTAVRGGDQYMFLLNVASTAFGQAISGAWIAGAHHAAAMAAGSSETKTCRLDLTCSHFDLRSRHYQSQSSSFHVAYTDPANGLPDPNASFQFFVPKYDGLCDEVAVPVRVKICINKSDESFTMAT